MDVAEVIRARRADLGMSQQQLADAAKINVRQIARYEAGDNDPSFSVAIQLAEALNISLAQLAGQVRRGLDLHGPWWACWQSFRDGEETMAIHRIEATQQGDILNLIAHERTRTVEEGGYLWTGELRLWDNEALIGWYRASEGAIRSKGSMYFALHAQGQHAIGRWVGLSYDSELETGFAVLARTEELLTEHITRLQAEDG